MIDRTDYTDHRMASAQATGDRDAAYRGWDLFPDASPRIGLFAAIVRVIFLR